VYDLPGIVGRFSLSSMKNRILPIEPSDRLCGNQIIRQKNRKWDKEIAYIEHEAWFAEFLAQGPSGHFRRRQVGESPFVSKFLHP
jgi:hypothetical protein